MATIISTKTSGVGGLSVTGDASGVLQLASANGTPAVTIDASQNVGIGTSNPATKLTVAVSGAPTTAQATYVGDVQLNRTAITSLQQVGGLEFKASEYGSGYGAKITGLDDGGLVFGNRSNSATWLPRMTIDSSGNLLVGGRTASSGITLGSQLSPDGYIGGAMAASTSANITLQIFSTTAAANRFYVDMGGTIHATSTSISAISDATLKTNIKPLETGLSEVLKLQPRRFDWVNGDALNVAGFIAQEVAEILPELVEDSQYSIDINGDTIYKKNLKMGDILPTLVKAIQELKAIIDTQNARIEALEGVNQ